MDAVAENAARGVRGDGFSIFRLEKYHLSIVTALLVLGSWRRREPPIHYSRTIRRRALHIEAEKFLGIYQIGVKAAVW
jgi:hypothetical protein